ncbi:MAG TPA: NAD-dependent epimerase/dehydratase family protein [Candidatus Krumholzibacteria bacterium]|nr:NAD-dependent epimerase/dehydratase family protein [Candidatus Krumholzibacteria bacterium]
MIDRVDVDVPDAWRGRPRRVLVTGCAGFLGSTLVDSLLAHGHDVTGIDVFSDYYDPALKRANVEAARRSDRFRLVEADMNAVDLVDIVADREVVFHFAAQAGVRASWGAEFDVYLHSNIGATQRLLEALVELRRRSAPFRRLVYSSSSSVYGNQEHYPVVEDVPKQPFSPYGVSKLAAEHLCVLYAANFGVPSSSLRYFTVYGPRQRPDMAFRKFLEAAADGRPWVVYGDGEQTRDFTFVADAVRANLLAADDPSDCGVYNIGGGARISLREALEVLQTKAIEHGVADEVKIEHHETVKGDVRHTYADGSRAREDLGFEARIPLAEGLDAEARWVAARRRSE